MVALDNSKIRSVLKEKRQQLSLEAYQSMSLLCYQRLINWNVFKNAQRIGIYYSTFQEVDTKLLINWLLLEKKTVLLPKIIKKSEMVFCEITNLADLEMGKFGILSPKSSCMRSHRIDLMIVPLLAYNKQGYRLGMGGGYYDRYLAKYPTLSCGLAFSFQMYPFQVYPHDIPLNYVITEKELLTFE